MRSLIAACIVWAVPFGAAFASEPWADQVRDADIVVVGEVHDNPAHHAVQAQVVARVSPQAMVFEMLEWRHVRAARGVAREDVAALEAALEWEDRGWPDFTTYAPIFAAAPDAALFAGHLNGRKAGALVRDSLMSVMPPVFVEAGLAGPLSAKQQAAREALQFAAHCEALPRAMLPMMVDIQRARDATLAFAALRAFEAHGGPVVVITGNGHARADWGVPAMLRVAAPDLLIAAIGQGEDGGVPVGGFDALTDAPAIDRDDPCDAFK